MIRGLMRIKPSSLRCNDKGTSNIISTMLLMVIFTGMMMSAISFAVPLLGRVATAADIQRAEDVLSALDANIRTNSEGTMEYRLFKGCLDKEKQMIDLQIYYSTNSSTYRNMSFSGGSLYYRQSENDSSYSISYPPEMSMLNSNTLHLTITEIEHDPVPLSGYHKIRFSSSQENATYTGDFRVLINDRQYNRSRYYSNISTVDLDIRKISIWDEEWRG
jgi:hypothetical protein